MQREFIKKILFIVCTSVFPNFLLAAGTYYNGNYTGLQNRYRQSAGFQASSYQPGQGRPMNISNTVCKLEDLGIKIKIQAEVLIIQKIRTIIKNLF